ncbi:MAG: zinc metallopeptidase [Deltaproteobacteria bacterium]|nr:zinc metallopeptidase [Deltaproteobacteria bacterium]
MFYLDPLYLALAAPGMLLGMWAQWRVKSAFSRWSEVRTRRGMTGAEVAAAILRQQQVQGIRIEQVSGFLSDHYDPTDRTLRLSPDVFHGQSVAAAGIAAHEVGHAIQHADAYAWLGLRSKLVPVLQITNRTSMPLIVGGMVLASVGVAALGQLAFQLGAILFGFTALFQIVTLPVEIDASRRALRVLDRGQILQGEELTGARAVLSAAAWTYVAAAISSLLTLLYYLMRSGLLGGRSRD